MRIEVHPSRVEEALAFAQEHGLASLEVGENPFLTPESALWLRDGEKMLLWWRDGQLWGLDVTLRL